MSQVSGDLKVEGLRKRIGDFRLEADFRLGPGDRAALIGRSGSGKTSLFRMIAGLSPLDEGALFLGGREITHLPPQAREIGVVFQENALFPSLNVLGNAAFGLQVRGVGRDEREARALEWLDRVGLRSQAGARVDRLSGGEASRVAFVRAILWKPRLLLLDEPFSALDPALRRTLRAELVELHRLWPVPLLLVSHDEADREAIATRRLELQEEEGGSLRRVVQSG